MGRTTQPALFLERPIEAVAALTLPVLDPCDRLVVPNLGLPVR